MKATPLLLAAAALSGGGLLIDRKEPDRLSATYYLFAVDTMFPVHADDLARNRQGWNVSSCLAPHRADLKKIMERASVPAAFDDLRARLFVAMDGERWAVDDVGVVRHAGKDLALPKEAFDELLTFMLFNLPPNGSFILKASERPSGPTGKPQAVPPPSGGAGTSEPISSPRTEARASIR